MFTHANVDALAGGEFFTRLAHKIVHSEQKIEKVEDLYNVMEQSIEEMEGYRKNFCKQQLQKGQSKYKEATNPDMPLVRQTFTVLCISLETGSVPRQTSVAVCWVKIKILSMAQLKCLTLKFKLM